MSSRPHRIKSLIKVGHLKPLFPVGTVDEEKFSKQLVRLCVLYEDLQIELAAVLAESVQELDASGRDMRRLYFLRRSLGTVMEIAQALEVMNSTAVVKSWRRGLGGDREKAWDDAVKWFAKEKADLKDFRDDLAGHFLDRAAKFVLDTLEPEQIGVIELFRRGNGFDMRLKLAHELAATALFRKNTEPARKLQFLETLFSRLVEAQGHARTVAQLAVGDFIFDRIR
jgi:hypothetical protein